MSENPPSQRAILPAADPKEGSESGEQGAALGAGGLSKDSGKLPKRAKVTAVACQPCQKRKSKVSRGQCLHEEPFHGVDEYSQCDGARPICTSCAQKGRTDCLYDSASDQRRTSALKQRIEGYQLENDALKDIIMSICSAYDNHNLEPTLRLVQQTLQQGDFSRVPELAEVLRKNTNAMASQANHASYQSANRYGQQGGQFDASSQQQQVPYSFGSDGTGMMREDTQRLPRTGSGQSEWSSGQIAPSEEQDEDMVQQQRNNYQGGGPSYMYPQ